MKRGKGEEETLQESGSEQEQEEKGAVGKEGQGDMQAVRKVIT